MILTFEGWYKESKELISHDDIWKQEDVPYTNRYTGFFYGFDPISGVDEEGIEYYYNVIKVYIYHNEQGTEVEQKALVPWYEGEDLRNDIDVPGWLEHAIENQIETTQSCMPQKIVS